MMQALASMNRVGCRLPAWAALLTAWCLCGSALATPKSEGWPVQAQADGRTVVLQQPRIDAWENLRLLHGRIPFEVRDGDGRVTANGTAAFQSGSVVHFESRTVALTKQAIKDIHYAQRTGDTAGENLARQRLSGPLPGVPVRQPPLPRCTRIRPVGF